jgi:phytoene dehydrogenase-like protein
VTADYVISAADMKRTLFSMLDGTRLDPLHKLLFDDPRLYPPCVLVNFGVNMDFTPYGDRGIWEFLRLEKPVELAGKTYTWLNVHNYAFDPSLAPEHKTVVETYIPCYGEYWERFRNDQESYAAEKDRIAAICAERIEERYPGFKARIEMTDVATPLTFEQYTLNWRGSYMTWFLSRELIKKYRYIPKTIPGLENFWLASMWTNAPGGTFAAAHAGRDVIQLLCRRDGKKFRTTTV